MARLAGVDIPNEKRIEIALTYIFGVGRTRAKETLAATGINPDIRVKDLTDEQLITLRDYLEGNYKIEGDLRREIDADIRRKIQINCYQGQRHRKGLPVRGQRTKTNARTRKGPKRTVGGKKKATKESVADSSSHEVCASSFEHQSKFVIRKRGSMAAQKQAARKPRRRDRKSVPVGQAHIKSTFNNTIISITDPSGAVVSWASGGDVGFKGSRKSTPYAAGMAAESAARKAMEHGLKKVDVFVKGPGSGRETAIRSLQSAGLEVGSITDVTPQAHNGVRPPKRRRV